MSSEENFLPTELEKLEIVSGRVSTAQFVDENPFKKRGTAASRTASVWNSRCSCASGRRVIRNAVSFKRNNNKLLKEPILKYINLCCYNAKNDEVPVAPVNHPMAVLSSQQIRDSSFFTNAVSDQKQDFKDLISECDQLHITSDNERHTVFSSANFQAAQNNTTQKPSSSVSFAAGPSVDRANTGTCSQQALNAPCDVTIDELASYFETLVHIPKKMSTMAEMMYT